MIKFPCSVCWSDAYIHVKRISTSIFTVLLQNKIVPLLRSWSPRINKAVLVSMKGWSAVTSTHKSSLKGLRKADNEEKKRRKLNEVKIAKWVFTLFAPARGQTHLFRINKFATRGLSKNNNLRDPEKIEGICSSVGYRLQVEGNEHLPEHKHWKTGAVLAFTTARTKLSPFIQCDMSTGNLWHNQLYD